MNKNRENFIKYSNDLYFHHLLVENKRIRTLICQELVSDRKIISTKLKNAQQYGKSGSILKLEGKYILLQFSYI